MTIYPQPGLNCWQLVIKSSTSPIPKFVLANNAWCKIDGEYMAKINTAVDSIEDLTDTLDLPSFRKKNRMGPKRPDLEKKMFTIILRKESSMIGKIQREPIRTVWPHEERDFSRWLSENLDVLDDVLDFSLTEAVREQAAGDFSVDLVAQDDFGNRVIIENQFGRSDHDHLGKLVTYASALDAKRSIWIVGEPRPEHIQAITTLNESKARAYYLVKLEAIKIGNSLPAALFTLIVSPSDEGVAIGDLKETDAETERLRRRFWTQLLAEAKKVTQLHANISPGINHWLSAGAGRSGLSFNYVVLKHEALVELYIDGGKQADLENKRIFAQLEKSKEAINSVFGGIIDWQLLPEKRACRIKAVACKQGLVAQDKWGETQKLLVDAMVRFERALRPHINNLD